MIQQELLEVIFDFTKNLKDIQIDLPELNQDIKEAPEIQEVFSRKKKLLKKVIYALKEDLTKEILKINSIPSSRQSVSKPKQSKSP